MIEVEIRSDHVTVIGHAGYAKFGQDIVCSGVSALTITLIESIKALSADKISCDVAPGNTIIEWKNLSEKSKILVDSFFIGISKICNAYPEHVRII